MSVFLSTFFIACLVSQLDFVPAFYIVMYVSCTVKIIPGIFMLVFCALTFWFDSLFGVFLITLVPVFAVDFLVFFGTGFGKLGTSISVATSSLVNLVPDLSFNFFRILHAWSSMWFFCIPSS